jgi:hypothetical protein
MVKRGNDYRGFEKKHEGKRPVKRPRRRWVI